MKKPELLGPAGAKWYQKTVKSFDFNPHEIEVLSAAAVCLDRMEQARQEVIIHGLLVSDSRGSVKKNPALEVEATNKKMFLDYCKTLKVLSDGTDKK